MNHLEIAFRAMIVHRDNFEIRAYDYLVQPLIPDDFWEPVVVSLSPDQISQFEKVSHSDECAICNEDYSLFFNLCCCNKEMCEKCVSKWFSTSVKCPFCVQDLRNCLKK
jgi:hypothetical protein